MPLSEGVKRFVFILGVVFSVCWPQGAGAQPEPRVTWGEAEGPVGPGQTQEDVIEALYLLARRDAASTVLALVGSDTRVRSFESERGVFEHTADEARAVTLAEIQEVEGTKQVERRLDEEGTLWVRVRAGFHVAPRAVDEKLASMSSSSQVSQTESRGNIEVLLDRISSVEDQLDLLARDPEASVDDLRSQVRAVKSAYDSLDGAIAALSGASIAEQLRNAREGRLRGLRDFLARLQDIAAPTELFRLGVVEEPRVIDTGQRREGQHFASLWVKAQVQLDPAAHTRLLQAYHEAQPALCGSDRNDRFVYDATGASPSTEFISFGLVAVLLDGNGNALAIADPAQGGITSQHLHYLPSSEGCNPNSVAYAFERPTTFAYSPQRGRPAKRIPTDFHGDRVDVVYEFVVPEALVARVERVQVVFADRESLRRMPGYAYTGGTRWARGGAVHIGEIEVTRMGFAELLNPLIRHIEAEMASE